MPWPFDSLISSVHGAFSRATAEYNQLKQSTAALEKNNALLKEQGVIYTGLVNIIANRYNGVANLRNLPGKAHDGALWAYYFAFNPHLTKDVQDSAKAWALAQLHAPTLHGLKVAAATVGGTTTADAHAFHGAARERVAFQTNTLAVSLAAGSAISYTLKQAGQYAKSEYMRLGLHYTRRTWQATGVIAFAYGLSRVADAMHEIGPFAQTLRDKRDTYTAGQRWEIDWDAEIQSLSSFDH